VSESGPITFDISELEKVAASLTLAPDEVKEILRLAMDDTAMWANKESAKDLGRGLGVPYPAMRKRIKAKKAGVGKNARIWYGINAIGLKYLKPKQTGGGVSTTAMSVPGAFIVPKLNSHVFKRTGEKRTMTRGNYRGQVREVIAKQELSVVDQATVILGSIVTPKVAAYFMDRLFFYLDRFSGQTEGTSRNKFQIK
jgi:hypothetical protein